MEEVSENNDEREEKQHEKTENVKGVGAFQTEVQGEHGGVYLL